MSREKRDYFFEALDAFLRSGNSGPDALRKAVESYAYVFYCDDGRTPLARGATLALKELEEPEKQE